jgi:hypothetical protein
VFDAYAEKRTLRIFKDWRDSTRPSWCDARHNTDTLRSDFAVLPALKLRTWAVKVKVLDLKKCK